MDRTETRKPPTRVVAGLFWRGNTVLVQQRLRDASRPLLWEFPGGKVEADESDAAALRRECWEEMCVHVTVLALAWQTTHAYDDLCVALYLYYAAMSNDAVPKPQQATRLVWLPAPDLRDLAFCAADVAVVDDLVTGRLGPPVGSQ